MNEKILAYLGFARKMGRVFAGMALEKKLDEKKIVLLLFFPSINEKNKSKLLRRDENVKYRDIEEVDFAKLGLKPCKALGLTDGGLSKAILDVLSEKEEADERQEKQERP